MSKDTSSPRTSISLNHMGGDGWFTLFLSTTFIILTGGLSILWSGRRVLHQALNTTAMGDANIELILIPGVRLSVGEPSHDFRLRLKRAHLLHQKHGCQLLLMGGLTGNESISEAAAGKKFLISLGVPPSAIKLEDGSRNTLENLHNAREQLRIDDIKHYALISNRYHLARCQDLAIGLKMDPLLCAAEDRFQTPLSSWPRLLLESYYVHWYHTGKLWSRITKNSHSLARIN